ncbi:hypothetical protein [Pseudomonas beijingensis]|uniref:Uncharacterized protein n=1 Tax=Pseudomonas beijingensis TaxID=2954101 RepID=A0ABY9F802_9PSED|nr:MULTISPECIES: hypothetical protein [unclassified Pseudomonas]WLG98958.1 hypothetical protein PSH92_16355 [Pseudomonas sp. FP2034]WLH44071.1 hypothetical protein PSH83_16925 [Pseudomonas sp. FP2262]WLI44060.1 hypothetical protein PSH84_21225 [Pseudomonas sp. FP830]
MESWKNWPICRGIAHLHQEELVDMHGRTITILDLPGLKQKVADCHRHAEL